jgi:hypothetical protein
MIKKIKEICDGIEYKRNIPQEAKDLAKEHGYIVIVGGSDDLMYCFGAESYLDWWCEHGYGWDGDPLQNIDDKFLQKEAEQLGLKIWWCGGIKSTGEKREGYNSDKMGAFSYTVKDEIESEEFKVMEDGDVYCTGIIIKLPSDFKSYAQNAIDEQNS